MASINNILPTVDNRDVGFFLKNLFANKDAWKNKVYRQLQNYFPNSTFLFFETGRAALAYFAKHALKENDAVYLQAFTCSAVPYPFLQNKIKPIYIDIDKDTFNISFKDLLKKASPGVKAILIQYTFGIIPKELDKILKFAKKHKLLVIEDLSHAFANQYKQVYLGNLADVALLSFGRDKVVSAVSGGALVINNKKLAQKLLQPYEKLSEPGFVQKFNLVFYLLFMSAAKRLYHWKMIRIKIWLLQKLAVLEKAVSQKEKTLENTTLSIKKFPKLFFPLLYHQLQKLQFLKNKRQETTKYYNQIYKKNYQGALLKYPLLAEDPEKLLQKKRKQQIYLDRWYANIIDPKGVDLQKYLYQKGCCPEAEKTAAKIINLPTLWKLKKL